MILSIIIPVYNVEQYLEKCLNSVIYPSIDNYEIIAVDDGSTDSSSEILADYSERYAELVKVITTSNGGLGAARNVGIEYSAGDYIIFLDSDDRLSPNAVPEIISELDGSFDICLFNIDSVNENGDIIRRDSGCNRYGSFSLIDNPELLFQLPAACNKIFRRSIFFETGIRFPGRVWFEDYRTIPKLYLHTDRIKAINKSWYLYLQRSGSITNSGNAARNLEIIDAAKDLLEYYTEHDSFDKYHDELEYSMYHNIFIAASVRVNKSSVFSPVQQQLLDYYLSVFPRYKENKYVKLAPPKYRFLEFLITNKLRLLLRIIMSVNDIVKNK